MNILRIILILFILVLAIPANATVYHDKMKEALSGKSAKSVALTQALDGHIFAKIELSNDTPEVDEKFEIKITLFSDWLDVDNIRLERPESDYIIYEKFSNTQPYIKTINKTRFAVLTYVSTAYSPMSGKCSIAPAKFKFTINLPPDENKLLNNNLAFYKQLLLQSKSLSAEISTQKFSVNIRETASSSADMISEEETSNKDPVRNIAAIKPVPGAYGDFPPVFHEKPVFAVIRGIFSLTILLLLPNFIHRRRMATDKQYAALYLASTAANKNIGRVVNALRKGAPRAFYEEIFELLKNYMAIRLFLPETSLQDDIIQTSAISEYLDSDMTTALTEILGRCYRIKYSGAECDMNEMKDTYRQIVDIINTLNGRKRII
ncbi:MAG TPA: hypothetical protein PKY78_09385 [Candidatus Omnitrophota bacterium]|nr:hypothetical protein [Candidatus Omnitrophota bacterium]HPS21180.1 hypothetical protein [Candidatus Omnitrophota bacterium]